MKDLTARIDQLLEGPRYLIDIFPCRVPETDDRRYFEVEKYFRKWRKGINEKFCRILLKLYCFYDFEVLWGEERVRNPRVSRLTRWIGRCLEGDGRKGDSMNILLPDCNAMIILSGDDLFISVYLMEQSATAGKEHRLEDAWEVCEPRQRLLELLSQFAWAEGLFFYEVRER